eukprot:COSAG01_NODE_69021_length_262_cov_1.251534_1_plen_32_part_10
MSEALVEEHAQQIRGICCGHIHADYGSAISGV